MSVEARYLGARSSGAWRSNDYNELNIIENGFLNEFKLAMTNLQANVAAGRGGTFAYFGPGTGTAPLPIFLAYFNGVPASRAGDASLYTSTNFRSTTFLNPLARFNPNPYSAVDNLDADAASRARAIAAGLPPNFIVTNPDLLGGANVVSNETRTMYHSGALEFRRRAVSGLNFATSYVFGNATNSRFLSIRRESPMVRNDGAEGDVTHAFKANVVYELPFGHGRRFGSSVNGALDRIIGGWQLAGNARVQSGQLVDLGNVRLVSGSTAPAACGCCRRRSSTRASKHSASTRCRRPATASSARRAASTSRPPTASTASRPFADGAIAACGRLCSPDRRSSRSTSGSPSGWRRGAGRPPSSASTC
jgi:hypothetical protein